MSDSDSTAVAERFHLSADFVEVHARGVKIEIEMKIDVEIEATRDVKDTRDLTMWVAVSVGASADQVRAGIARGNQQFVRAWIVQQPFLRKHADLKVDCPRVIALELPQRIE